MSDPAILVVYCVALVVFHWLVFSDLEWYKSAISTVLGAIGLYAILTTNDKV